MSGYMKRKKPDPNIELDIMRERLQQRHPTWHMEAWDAQKIRAVYKQEQRQMLSKVIDYLLPK